MKKWILLTALLFTTPSWAQDYIEVTGQARLSIPADYVELNIGIDSRSQGAAQAARANAEDMATLVIFLRDKHIAKEDMLSTQFSLQAQHDYQKNQITSYTASRTLRVKVRDTQAFDQLLVDLAQRGGNRLNGYQAKLIDPQQWQAKLLVAASDNAHEKAQILAQANKRQLGQAIYISELGQSSPIRPEMSLARTAMADTAPVRNSLQVGEVQLSKQLVLRYSFAE